MNEHTQSIISNILKHERKSNSYKIALVRAINDAALEYPHRPPAGGVAVPLRLLAEFWLAYLLGICRSRKPNKTRAQSN